MPAHTFFVINAACFIGLGILFVLIAKPYVGARASATLFLVVNVFHYQFLAQYLVPWSTIPVAFLLYAVFLIYERKIFSYPAMALLGLCSGMIIPIRPADVLILSPFYLCLPYLLYRATRHLPP